MSLPISCCNLCGSSERSKLGRCSLPIELRSDKTSVEVRTLAESVRDSELYECHQCGLRYRKPQLDEQSLGQLYRELPAQAWDYVEADIQSWNVAGKVIRKRFAGQSEIKIVDIGAFDGRFLSMLPKSWNKAAVEPCNSVLESLKQRDIRWISDFPENIPDAEFGQFDVATMFDVFEHLPDPQTTIRQIVRLLRPGGMFLFSTGNSSHWSWNLLAGQHWYLHTIQHLSFANPRSIRWLAEAEGLKLQGRIRHSHQRRTLRHKFQHSLETLHWRGRMSHGPQRHLAGLIQRLPGQRRLMHRDRAPMAVSLNDHMLVCLAKPTVSKETPKR
ncbi:class I SAM-dependent methyltransferase [Rhodopirellula sp. MGV]|uniref:class I SAM-dependent methyltransferase n=1 Tax=Rhodopirellula sp. MGV TaxID=2023130 RepID=UPI000B96D605|nr:class I SAM-dependent methyltransferase [Rhodopirellula sp. MGV]OYP39166.1 hypothetical protein CGZ80_00520 [Rhodopirellula sp. MGV]PNY35456.1 class I SAM-dependent methyltransferase [Rhodopirellula baltica]